jgi:hypothetical protein
MRSRSPFKGLNDIGTAVTHPDIECRQYRLMLSMIDSTRILRLSKSWSDRKSIDQHSLGADAGALMAVRGTEDVLWDYQSLVPPLASRCRGTPGVKLGQSER